MAVITTIGNPTFGDRNIAVNTVMGTAMAMGTERAGTPMVEGHPVDRKTIIAVVAGGKNSI